MNPGSVGRKVLFLVAALVLSPIASHGQPPAQAPSLSSRAEFHEYLERKYLLHRLGVEPQHDHLHGPRWSISAEGALTPPAAAGQAARAPDEVRAFPQAFFSEEAALLGLTPLSEMREINLVPSQWGLTVIAYQHYVAGLRLEDASVSLTIQHDGYISWFRASIVSTSPQLLQAVTRPTLSEPQIQLLIQRDLEAAGLDPRRVIYAELEKVAIGAPPYVLWKAHVGSNDARLSLSCRYTMDAFSGQVLERMSSIQTLVPLRPDEAGGCPRTDRTDRP